MKTIQIQDDIHRELRVFAAKQGTTMSGAVSQLLSVWEGIENAIQEGEDVTFQDIGIQIVNHRTTN